MQDVGRNKPVLSLSKRPVRATARIGVAYMDRYLLLQYPLDLHGWRKCRKIAWSNRGHHIHVDYVGKGREHDCMDAGGRVPTVGALGDAGVVAEERKLFR
ncbi:MAG: hypothetical protein EPO18_15090 [Methylobacter sp.]|nr:MAG: hypothetical protein EPO18_15090 [Methylobacter sp.]